jgi:hypothetical protein
MTSTLVRVGAQRPRLSLLPATAVDSAADEVIALAGSCGLFFDDWQEWVLRNLLAEDAAGRLAAQQALLLVPRQNGKNAILEAVELGALYVFDERRIIHTAQLAKTAADHMQRMVALIKGNPRLEAVTQFFFASNDKRIMRTDTGGQIEFITRGKKAVRGGSPQRVVFDEALYLNDDQMQAIIPALSAQSMNTENSPQIIYTSSAPLPESDVLHRLRSACIAGGLDRVFFAEWSCAPGVDPSDREAWYEANPALGIRISEQWVAENELPVLSEEAFLVERLGVVFGSDADSGTIVGWGECLDGESQMGGKPAIAVDADPNLEWTSIAVAGHRADGLLHVELVDRFPSMEDAVAVLVAMHRKWQVPVHLDAKAAAGALVPLLLGAKVPVVETATADLLKACAGFKQQVADRKLRHRGQQPLDVAVAGAAVRTIGEGWAWARRSSSVSISPLVAVTLAANAVRSKPERSDAWIAWE